MKIFDSNSILSDIFQKLKNIETSILERKEKKTISSPSTIFEMLW